MKIFGLSFDIVEPLKSGLRVVIKNCKLFREQPKWNEWQKQIGDIRNSLAHNSFMKLSEDIFKRQSSSLWCFVLYSGLFLLACNSLFLNFHKRQLQTIKHVLVEIDMSEDLENNHVFNMAQEQINKIYKWYEHLSQVNTSHSTLF